MATRLDEILDEVYGPPAASASKKDAASAPPPRSQPTRLDTILDEVYGPTPPKPSLWQTIKRGVGLEAEPTPPEASEKPSPPAKEMVRLPFADTPSAPVPPGASTLAAPPVASTPMPPPSMHDIRQQPVVPSIASSPQQRGAPSGSPLSIRSLMRPRLPAAMSAPETGAPTPELTPPVEGELQPEPGLSPEARAVWDRSVRERRRQEQVGGRRPLLTPDQAGAIERGEPVPTVEENMARAVERLAPPPSGGTDIFTAPIRSAAEAVRSRAATIRAETDPLTAGLGLGRSEVFDRQGPAEALVTPPAPAGSTLVRDTIRRVTGAPEYEGVLPESDILPGTPAGSTERTVGDYSRALYSGVAQSGFGEIARLLVRSVGGEGVGLLPGRELDPKTIHPESEGARLVGMLAGMAADFPLFTAGGKLATSALNRLVNTLYPLTVKAGVELGLAEQAARQAAATALRETPAFKLAFGLTYPAGALALDDAVKKAGEQALERRFDPLEIAGAAGKGAALGAAVGMAGPAARIFARDTVLDTPTLEVLTMLAGFGTIGPLMEGRTPTVGDLFDAGVTLGVLHLATGLVGALSRRVGQLATEPLGSASARDLVGEAMYNRVLRVVIRRNPDYSPEQAATQVDRLIFQTVGAVQVQKRMALKASEEGLLDHDAAPLATRERPAEPTLEPPQRSTFAGPPDAARAETPPALEDTLPPRRVPESPSLGPEPPSPPRAAPTPPTEMEAPRPAIKRAAASEATAELVEAVTRPESQDPAGLALPSVAEGYVRLYRGAGVRTKDLPDWVKIGTEETGQAAAEGRWFTSDPAIAQWYVDDAPNGRLSYVDVPQELATQTSIAALPEGHAARRFSRDPDNEHFLPAEWATRAASAIELQASTEVAATAPVETARPTPPETPAAPPPMVAPSELEAVDPMAFDQMARFVRAHGGIAPSPSGDLAGNYAAVSFRFKNRRGLSPSAMAEAFTEATGQPIRDRDILRILTRAQGAVTAADRVRRREEAWRDNVADAAERATVEADRTLTDDELIRDTATLLGAHPDDVRVTLFGDAAPSPTALVEPTAPTALDAPVLDLLSAGQSAAEGTPARQRYRDLIGFLEEAVDAAGTVAEAKRLALALPEDAVSTTAGDTPVQLTKADQVALLEARFPEIAPASAAEERSDVQVDRRGAAQGGAEAGVGPVSEGRGSLAGEAAGRPPVAGAEPSVAADLGTGEPAPDVDRSGRADDEAQDEFFREEPARYAPPFFSPTRRLLDQKMPARASTDQVRDILKGAKQDEVRWLGLRDWLDAQRGPVSKADVLAFVDANEVRVEEVVKGGNQEEIRAATDAYRTANEAFRSLAEGRLQQIDIANIVANPQSMAAQRLEENAAMGDLLDAAQAMWFAEGDLLRVDTGATKFSNYQLPGGTDYRELLLRLPLRNEGRWEVFDPADGVAVRAFDTESAARTFTEQELSRGGRRLDYEIAGEGYGPRGWAEVGNPRSEPSFRSPHWDQPNVLLHVRFNERMDAEGRRLLFIEEIQSDWLQQGRKSGVVGEVEVRPNLTERGEQNGFEGYDRATGYRLTGVYGTQEQARSAAINRQQEADSKAVPTAPFATTWPSLGLKRMIRWGAEHDFDVVAWTPGSVQAERYDLSKHLKEVRLEADRADSPYPRLIGVTHDGKPGIEKTLSKDDALADFIGKEAAERLEAAPWQPHPDGGVVKSLSGLDLKVGGEGMTGFYDRLLVDAANSLGKRWGTRVGTTVVRTDNAPPDVVARYADQPEHPFTKRQRATAHALPITSSMRQSVLAEGFSLFEPGRQYTERRDASPRTRALARGALADLRQLELSLPAPADVPAGGGADLRAGGSRLVPRGPERAGFRLRSLGISPQLVAKGVVSFRGQSIAGPEGLAVIAQVLRDPRFETMRAFYVRREGEHDIVAGEEAVSSRLPSAAPAFWVSKDRKGPEPDRLSAWADETLHRMRDLGADGLYLLHNHPSGNPAPSTSDVRLTQDLVNALRVGAGLAGERPPEFRGHVVIDSGKYALISLEGETTVHPLPNAADVDTLLSPSVPDAMLGQFIKEPSDVARIGQSYAVSGDYVTLMFTDAELRLRAAGDLPVVVFSDAPKATRIIRRLARAYGAPSIFSHYRGPETRAVDVAARLMIESGLLLDHQTGEGASLRGEGARSRGGFTLGVPDTRFGVERAVRSPQAPYGDEPDRTLPRGRRPIAELTAEGYTRAEGSAFDGESDAERRGRALRRQGQDVFLQQVSAHLFTVWARPAVEATPSAPTPMEPSATEATERPVSTEPRAAGDGRGAPPEEPPVTAPPAPEPEEPGAPRPDGADTVTTPPPPDSPLGRLHDMANQPVPSLSARARLRRAKNDFITSQVNKFHPVGVALRESGAPDELVRIVLSVLELTKNKVAGGTQNVAQDFGDVYRDAGTRFGREAGPEALNDVLWLHQFAKRIRVLSARPDSGVSPEGHRTDDGQERLGEGASGPRYVNPREFDMPRVDAGLDQLRERLGPEGFAALEDLGRRIWAINRGVLDRVHEAGVVSDTGYDVLRGRGDDYVPMQVLDFLVHDATPGPRSAAPMSVRYQSYLRTMEGTERDVRPALEASLDKAGRAISEAERNIAARTALTVARHIGIAEEIPGNQFTVPGDRKVLSVFENGERHNYAVPSEVADAMTFLNASQFGLVQKILQAAATPLRAGATGMNLGFALVTNPPRDIKDMLSLFKYGWSPLDAVRGLMSAYHHDAAYRRALESGALFSTFQKSLTPEAPIRRAAGLAAEPGWGVLKTPADILRWMTEHLGRISNITEEGTKMAGVIRAGRHTEPVAPEVAEMFPFLDVQGLRRAYEVANYAGSPNFGRSGTIGPEMNVLQIFYNARLQGVARTVRRVREDPGTVGGKRLAFRMLAYFVLPAIALWALNREYDDNLGVADIAPSDRQRYSILLLPWIYQAADGSHRRAYLKLAKNESDQVIAPLVTAALDWLNGTSKETATKLALDMVGNVSPIPFDVKPDSPGIQDVVGGVASGVLAGANPLIRVPIETTFNYVAYRQSRLVPQSLEERVLAPDQARPTTSPIIRSLSRTLARHGVQISPIKLEYAVTSSTGGLGQTALDAVDRLAGKTPAPTAGPYEKAARLPALSRLLGTAGGEMNRETEQHARAALDRLTRTTGSLRREQEQTTGPVRRGTQRGVPRATTERAQEIAAIMTPRVVNRLAGDLRVALGILGDIRKSQSFVSGNEALSIDARRSILADLATKRGRQVRVLREGEEVTHGWTQAYPADWRPRTQ